MSVLGDQRRFSLEKALATARLRIAFCVLAAILFATCLTCMMPFPSAAVADDDCAEDGDISAFASNDVVYAPGQAIVCVRTGFEKHLACVSESIEPLVVLGGAVALADAFPL